MTSNQLNSAFTLFLSLLVEAVPFLLLGVLFSGLLLFFVDERQLIRLLPKHPFLGAFAGSCVGFLFPVCECGNVPVARRLLMQGAPSPVAIGFLLAAPTINPIVFWATWTAFRDQPEIVFLRIGFSLAIATLLGYVFSLQSDLRPFLQTALARSMPAKRKARPQSKVSASPLLQSGTFWLGEDPQAMNVSELQAAMVATETLAHKPLADKLNLLLENTIQELRELGGS